LRSFLDELLDEDFDDEELEDRLLEELDRVDELLLELDELFTEVDLLDPDELLLDELLDEDLGGALKLDLELRDEERGLETVLVSLVWD